jgi:uncharacterized protein
VKVLDHGFTFYTKKGNQYLYNDLDGSVTPIENSDIIKFDTNITSRNHVTTDDYISTIEQIKRHIENESHQQLLLVVTEQCNLRCRYCAYSGQYINNRTHKNTNMSWQIAEQAVKLFYEGYSKVKLRDPSLVPAMSFYGGEPLLNFDLIRKVFFLVRSLIRAPIHFNLTTNGILITDEILDFFKNNDFYLLFSLNGNQNEHDRLRVFPNGSGSFSYLWQNLQMIRNKYPDYYLKNCNFNVVYDIGTNFYELQRFLEENKLTLPSHYTFSAVSSQFTNWYSRYSVKDRSLYVQSIEELKKEYFKLLRENRPIPRFFSNLFGKRYKFLIDRQQNTSYFRQVLPITGTCIPGDKIAVYPDGSLHCCERINDHFSIGNIDTGLDVQLIENIVSKYINQIYPDCYKCPITRLCGICFAIVAGNGRFLRDPTDVCIRRIEGTCHDFEELWTLLEEGVPESAFSENLGYIQKE